MPNVGFKHTEESRKKISESLKGMFAGEKNPMWHKEQSEETREKKRIASTGKKHTEEFKERMRGKNNPNWGKIAWNHGKKTCEETLKKFSGANCHLWKGGITPENDAIRHSFKYKNWRKTIHQRDDFTCQKCKHRGGDMAAHHIESFHNNPKLRTEMENGVTLCRKCHRNFHHIFGVINTRKQFNDFIKNY